MYQLAKYHLDISKHILNTCIENHSELEKKTQDWCGEGDLDNSGESRSAGDPNGG